MRAVTVMMLLLVATGLGASLAAAQDQPIQYQWNNVKVGQAMEALQRNFDFNYVLSPEVAERRVTASFRNVQSAEQAIRDVADAAGLDAVFENGTWRMYPRQENSGPVALGAAGSPSARSVQAVVSERQMPAPTRPVPTVSFGGGAQGSYFSGSSTTTQPGMGGMMGQQGGMMGAQTQGLPAPEAGDLVLRLVDLKFINPYMAASLFGGGAISEQAFSSTGMGGGGYGGSSGSYGSGGYGSNSSYGSGNSGYGGSGGSGGRSGRGGSSGGGRSGRGGSGGGYSY